MVLQKRLDYGFNGYQVPYTPRATRSARRRSSFKKRGEDNQMCAFDLLATIAGKLLLDKQTPTSSIVSTNENQSAVVKDSEKKEMQDENKQLRVETSDQGSWDRGLSFAELLSLAKDKKYALKESTRNQEDAPLGFASAVATSDCSGGFGDQKLVDGKAKSEMGILASRVETSDQGSWISELSFSELLSLAKDKKYTLKESTCNQEDAPLGFVSAVATSDCSGGFGDQKLVDGKAKSEMGILASRVETSDQGSWISELSFSELLSLAKDKKYTLKESTCNQEDAPLGFASAVATSDCSGGFGDQKLVDGKAKSEMGILASRVEVGPSGYREYGVCKIEDENKKIIKDELHKTEKVQFGTRAKGCRLDNPVVWDEKPPVLVSSDSSTKLPFCRDQSPHSSFPANRDYVNVVSRDDDENSSGCTHPNTIKKSFRPVPRIGDRRIRKILASKYWKVGPKLKDVTHSNANGELRTVYRNRNISYGSVRSEKNYPIKKRRIFNYSSVSNFNGGISGEDICVSPKRVINGDVSGLCSKIHEAAGASSSAAGLHTTFQSRDSYVKLRIKSFRVPELFIEMPETATVGSLKRRVMEAVNAILGGGLHVGVLLQGKKVRDDSKTLLQTGISHDNQLNALGFSLEPNTSKKPRPLCPGDSPFLLPCNAPQPLTRYTSTPSIIHQGTCEVAPELHVTSMGNFIESDHDSATFPTDMSIDKSTKDSKALVTVPAMSVEALAVVPVHQKSKHSEIVQRRIRRPFSVAEVEALVQAVETLGTGRWRDVKLQAFDDAKHRTYVDLKDKWKTLVHTAKISPQQRRGEPVPQELLDRVLTAHAYWSQQQAKQQLEPQPETCLLLKIDI
ncbi:telomere repeat-binding protein 5-like [Mangifera indica]|uniref:telomere repeat-binding protein 5-like n=1 Tax=Mangifera indica TaxID=29780 RepID=UPI001CFBCC58|nr:telomere repeat-binding protein 5-like [Mangifera indica]